MPAGARPAAAVATSHPIRSLIGRRLALGVLTVLVVSALVYFATHVLPGDAATAILGQQATPARLRLLRHQLGLDRSAVAGFRQWLTAAVQGDFGQSLAERIPVTTATGPRLANSVVLIAVTAVVSSILGILLGVRAAFRRDGVFDSVVSVVALVMNALPEFVVGVLMVVLFSINVFQWLPALSILPPDGRIWDEPNKLVLPVATLVLVITPYTFRMVRAAMIEALGSDYVEVARLKGVPPLRLGLYHALPNALAATVQVIGLNLLYLAGGIVLVERVFNYPGIGNLLVNAITDRDVPLIQFLVVLLAGFYVVLNIVVDVVVLLLTPRRRYPR